VPDRGFELSTELAVRTPIGRVFEFLTDTANFHALDDALVDFGPPGPLSAGRVGWFRHRRGVMTARTTWTVTALEAPTDISVEVRGMGYAMTETARLASTPTGTSVTLTERIWPTSLPGRLLVALSGGVMRRDLRARLERLRSALSAIEAEA